MDTPKLRFIMDDGHGWLEVPTALLTFQPSRYSYYSDATWGRAAGMAYLEEDVDMPRFLQSISSDFYDANWVEEVLDGSCWVRKLPRFATKREED
jgi:hypothetical protein